VEPRTIDASDLVFGRATAMAAMGRDELIQKLHQRQNNGMTDYITFGELVAMVPGDQVDEWQAVLAKARATDARREEEDE
jgi:hypothetical protein